MISVEDPEQLLLLTADILSKSGIAYALYGGLALAAYGIPRETGDVDHAILNDSVDDIKNALTRYFPNSVIPFERMNFGGLAITRITVVASGSSNLELSGLNTVDLVSPLNQNYAKRAMQRSLIAPLRGQEVRLLAPEDFIIFKCFSDRAKDLDDAKSVYQNFKDRLDLSLIEKELGFLAASGGNVLLERWAKVSMS